MVDAISEVMSVLRNIIELTKKGAIGWVIGDVIDNGITLKGSLSPYTINLSVQIIPYTSRVLVAQSEKQPVAPPLSLTQIFHLTVKENDVVVLHHTVDPNMDDPITPLIRELYAVAQDKINEEAPTRFQRLKKTLEEYLK